MLPQAPATRKQLQLAGTPGTPPNISRLGFCPLLMQLLEHAIQVQGRGKKSKEGWGVQIQGGTLPFSYPPLSPKTFNLELFLFPSVCSWLLSSPVFPFVLSFSGCELQRTRSSCVFMGERGTARSVEARLTSPLPPPPAEISASHSPSS